MQHILVCAHDSVLAKKVRFLLANERCDVEILDETLTLDNRLGHNDVDLLVLSRQLAGEDAIELLGRINPGLVLPPTLVLGGDSAVTADFIHLIPDPIDTQAIYRIASEILELQENDTKDEETLMALERPDAPDRNGLEHDKTAKLGIPKGRGDELNFTDVTGLDEIAGRLDQLESDQLNEQLSDAFDIDEASEVAPPARRPPAKTQPQVAGGTLEPARFAKALFQCWSKQVNGALVVVRDDETSTIYMERGSPVHIESSIPGDQLGRALVARGRVTDAQYADGAKRAIERGVPLGQALVDLGFFSEAELGKELGNTTRDGIVACFAARQGNFELDGRRSAPTSERPYRLDLAHIIASGLRTHADQTVLANILGEIDERYFKLNKTISQLAETYPLDDRERAFLAFEGRAYNVQDASESSGLSLNEAYKLMALLTTCEEIQDFTPGVREFEDRIRDEKKIVKELQSSLPASASQSSLPSVPPVPKPQSIQSTGSLPPIGSSMGLSSDSDKTVAGAPPGLPPLGGTPSGFGAAGAPWGEMPEEAAPPPPPPPPPPQTPPPFQAAPPAMPPPSVPAQPQPSEDIPPMPVPADSQAGMIPRPLVYAKPLPRGADGQALETSERTLSREHFQRGVTLLGQGNFANAEEAFRDAVALCSEEHVYLIGLARAIYYNPGYGAPGKLPVLRGIVDRAQGLAPDDKRVATLMGWVEYAAQTMG